MRMGGALREEYEKRRVRKREKLTLDSEVESVVNVGVNLLGITVLLEHPPEDPEAPHPNDLEGKPGVGGTAPLTDAGVAALPLGLVLAVNASTGVDVDGLADHVTVLHLQNRTRRSTNKRTMHARAVAPLLHQTVCKLMMRTGDR